MRCVIGEKGNRSDKRLGSNSIPNPRPVKKTTLQKNRSCNRGRTSRNPKRIIFNTDALVGMGRFELPTLAGHGSEPCAYAVPPNALSLAEYQLCRILGIAN